MSFIIAGCVLLLALLAGVVLDDLPRATRDPESPVDRRDGDVPAR